MFTVALLYVFVETLMHFWGILGKLVPINFIYLKQMSFFNIINVLLNESINLNLSITHNVLI